MSFLVFRRNIPCQPTNTPSKTARNVITLNFTIRIGKERENKNLKEVSIVKKDAKAYEITFLAKLATNPTVPFEILAEKYLENCKNKALKITTLSNKDYLIRKHILPIFKDKAIGDIDTYMIAEWQRGLYESSEVYAPTYIHNINNLLKYIFDYAVKIYKLPSNPVRICGSIGKARNNHMDYWTPDEFSLFTTALQDTKRNRSAQIKRKTDEHTLSVAFTILFYCGLRVGELLALTHNDIDLESSRLSITKTYKRFKGTDLILQPKTKASVRNIKMPAIVHKMLSEYLLKLPSDNPQERIFQAISYNSLYRAIHSEAKLLGLKEIRVHDLRHSCASMLANAGCDYEQIKAFLGHNDVRVTLNIYTHLYPHKFDDIANKIDKLVNTSVEENKQN